MRTLHFCCGCGILLSEEEQKDPQCGNCDTETSAAIPGEFTEDNAEKLEMAYSDQTS